MRALLLLLAMALVFNACQGDLKKELRLKPVSHLTIVFPVDASNLERLAAKEIRRYLYLRTGRLIALEAIKALPESRDLILVTDDSHPLVKSVTDLEAPAGGYFIKTKEYMDRDILVISGDDTASTLYGAYRFAEKLGCRFYLHGDVVPDKKIPLSIAGFDEQGQPLTRNGRQIAVRGIQPFQNFPAGPVMWGTDDWKMHIAQLPKMAMNFIGLHTYMYDPEDDHVGDYGPNLNIWLGHEDDLNHDGTVDFAFDATFFHTHQDIIGWGHTNTSNLVGGTSQLFPTDGYPTEFIGETYHRDQAGYMASFNRAARLFSEVFALANELGVITATGIEIPLGRDGAEEEESLINGIPELLQERLRNTYGIDPYSPEATEVLFRGMYKWLLYNEIPIDYMWLWTTEIWLPWGGASLDSVRIATAEATVRTAVEVFNSIDPKPFKQFAMGGWLTGAQGNPDVFGDVLPDLNAPYACMNPPLDLQGRRMQPEEWIPMVGEARAKWPFTWFEYDFALEQPSFHGRRVVKDVINAWDENADGLIAEFWRTKMLAPMFALYRDLTWSYAATGKSLKHALPEGRTERHQKIDEVYLDWANHEFGSGPVAARIASDLARFDKTEHFPNVTNFIEGADDIYSQGYILGDDWGSDHVWGPWEEEAAQFDWIDQWDDLRTQIQGAGNLARFDYWHTVYQAHQLMCEFASNLNQYEAKTDEGDLTGAAKHRSRLARLWKQIMSTKAQAVHDEVDLGAILNLDWRTWRNWVVGKYDKKFIEAGGTLPVDNNPSQAYSGGKFITVIPVLSQVKPDEAFNIKTLIMGDVSEPTLYYRNLGAGSFTSIPLTHDARAVFRGTIPGQADDFEWYITAKTSLGAVVFPASAGADPAKRMYQTVVVSF
jgi:hypothetical protein